MNVAINGFGRIGRTFFRQAFGSHGVNIVAINDLGDLKDLAYLLKYDSVYRRYDKSVETKIEGDPSVAGQGKQYLVVNGKEIIVLQQKDPAQLPWKDLGVDVVVESTGFFASEEGGKLHTQAGAKYVVISAPAKGDVPHVLIGTNTQDLKKSVVVSNASCTTNCTGPVASVMYDNPGIEKAILTTVHAYTATQPIVDGPVKNAKSDEDFAGGRAGAMNIVPHSTGAAEATAKAIPGLEGIFTGVALRVPVPAGSITDFTFLAKRNVTVDEIKDIFRNAAKEERWQGILEVSEEPLVSSDILGTTAGAIVDLEFIRVVDGNLVKVLAWYDNEWGYSAMLLREVVEIGKLL